MPKSTDLANKILDHVFGKTSAYTAPTNLYIALFSVAPNAGGTGGTELSIAGYTRALIANTPGNFPAASAGSKAIGADITFPTITGAGPVTVVAFGIYDAITAGNFLAYGAVSPSKDIAAGDIPFFASGSGLQFLES